MYKIRKNLYIYIYILNSHLCFLVLRQALVVLNCSINLAFKLHLYSFICYLYRVMFVPSVYATCIVLLVVVGQIIPFWVLIVYIFGLYNHWNIKQRITTKYSFQSNLLFVFLFMVSELVRSLQSKINGQLELFYHQPNDKPQTYSTKCSNPSSKPSVPFTAPFSQT